MSLCMEFSRAAEALVCNQPVEQVQLEVRYDLLLFRRQSRRVEILIGACFVPTNHRFFENRCYRQFSRCASAKLRSRLRTGRFYSARRWSIAWISSAAPGHAIEHKPW